MAVSIASFNSSSDEDARSRPSLPRHMNSVPRLPKRLTGTPTRCAVRADMPVRPVSPTAHGRILNLSGNFYNNPTTNPPLEDFGASIEHLIKPNLVSDFG
jgi:hypothetical protein